MVCKTFLIIFVLLIGSWFSVYSQTSPDDTRGLKPREYAKDLQNRILARRLKSAQYKPAKSVNYTTADRDDTLVAQGTDIGLTFWRLRESKEADDPNIIETKRIAVRKQGQVVEQTVKMTPERAESDTQFADGDLLRLTVELPTEGYIYILDREQYVDGTFSDPYLIFPSKRDIGKTDRVVAGKLLFIPNEVDSFELKRYIKGSPEKTAEVFTLLVTPQPLKELPPLEGIEPRKIDLEQFERWKQDWGGQTWKFEQEGGAGVTITKAEKNAGVTSSLTLTKDDQLPQTIYHVAHRAGSPLLFTVPIQIRR